MIPKKAENVATLGSPALGDREAPVTLIEFTDYEYPFCKHSIKRLCANCAGEQDKFWAMHDALFEGNNLISETINNHATQIGLELESFQSYLKEKRYKKQVDNDFKNG